MTQIQYIIDILGRLEVLYREVEAVNPRRKLIELATENKKLREQLDQISKMICKMNSLYRDRERESGAYIVEREDILQAIHLIRKTLQPNHYLNLPGRVAAKQIKETYKNESFNAPQLRKLLGYQRAQMSRILKELEYHQIIEKVGGYKNTGYFYRLIPKDGL
jgi:hypothetical protein